MLEARTITVAKGNACLLDAVSLALRPNELVAIIGPNGAGKSTAMRILAGIEDPSRGSVALDGKPFDHHGRQALARHIAFLPQQGPAHWALTVERLVSLGRLPHGAALDRLTPEDRAAVARAMDETDVAHLARRPVDTLSGGERARVLTARALAVEARFLIADEPTGALDPRHQLDLMTILRRRAEAGTGILVALHDLTLAARFCTRLILLAGGRTCAEGTAAEVLTPENLALAYGIAAHRGAHQGESYVLPWSVL
jgi:iron complex transport system ATP-binding protein